ncbi:MAG TPA: GNAT family N-acetyltransferase [Gammaproteobacteria bacterium]|nr:GNAT family N-acetyltransferase [Gammaproteobacteria bacterium]
MKFKTLISLDEFPWNWIEENRGNNIFLSTTYMQSWIRHHLRDAELECIILSENSNTETVFPIVVSSERFLGKHLKIWRSIGWNTSWYPNIFMPSSRDTARWFFSFLVDSISSWDAVIIPCFDEGLVSGIREIASDFCLPTFIRNYQVLPFLSINQSWEDYYRGLSKNLRKNIKRLLNKIEKSGRFAYQKAEDEQDLQKVIEVFIRMHNERWKSKGQQSKYADIDRHRKFLRDITSALLRDDKLLLRYLTLDETIIAIAICFCENGKIYYFLPTFDIRYDELAPGKVLLYYIIKEGFDTGCCEFDLGPGNDNYKWLWAMDKRTVTYLVVFHDSWRVWVRDNAIPKFKRTVKPIIKRLFPGLAR